MFSRLRRMPRNAELQRLVDITVRVSQLNFEHINRVTQCHPLGAHSRLEKCDTRHIRIQPYTDTERHRPVHIRVTGGEPRGTGMPCGSRDLSQHLGGGEAPIAWLTAYKLAKDDPADLTEHTGELQVRPHSVESVRLFREVLEKEDSPLERRHERSPQQPREHGEVAPQQGPLGGATNVGFTTDQRLRRASSGFQQRKQTSRTLRRDSTELG